MTDNTNQRGHSDAVAAAFAAADERTLDDWRADTDLWEVTVHQDGEAFLDHLDRLARNADGTY